MDDDSAGPLAELLLSSPVAAADDVTDLDLTTTVIGAKTGPVPMQDEDTRDTGQYSGARGRHDFGSISPPVFPGNLTGDIPSIDDVRGVGDPEEHQQTNLSTIHAPDLGEEAFDELAALFLPVDDPPSLIDGDATEAVNGNAATTMAAERSAIPADDLAVVNGAPVIDGAPLLEGAPPIDGASMVGDAPAPDSISMVNSAPEVESASLLEGEPAIDVPVIDGASMIHAVPVIDGAPMFDGVPVIEGAPVIDGSQEIDGAPVVDGAPVISGAPLIAPPPLSSDASQTTQISPAHAADLASGLKYSTEAGRPGGMQWSTVVHEPGSEQATADPGQSVSVPLQDQRRFLEQPPLASSIDIRAGIRVEPAQPALLPERRSPRVPEAFLAIAERRWFWSAVVGCAAAVVLIAGMGYLALRDTDSSVDADAALSGVGASESAADELAGRGQSGNQQESPVSAQLTPTISVAPRSPRVTARGAASPATTNGSGGATTTADESSTTAVETSTTETPSTTEETTSTTAQTTTSEATTTTVKETTTTEGPSTTTATTDQTSTTDTTDQTSTTDTTDLTTTEPTDPTTTEPTDPTTTEPTDPTTTEPTDPTTTEPTDPTTTEPTDPTTTTLAAGP